VFPKRKSTCFPSRRHSDGRWRGRGPMGALEIRWADRGGAWAYAALWTELQSNKSMNASLIIKICIYQFWMKFTWERCAKLI
jgi:hypothetical protein